MLVEPDKFIENLKDDSIESLVRERNKIIRKIQYYEENKHNRDQFDIYPSPETEYGWNNVVLMKLTNMIIERNH